jgi:hypothetical protein
MSLFREAKSITDADMFYKVLVYGPRGVGKTHFALGAPEPAVLDLENRAHHFRSLFDFKVAGLDTIDSVREGFREILRGHIPCKSIVIDSNSAMYQRLVDKYTSPNKDGKPVTDYVLVNKDMLAFTGFVFSITGRNVVVLAHQVDKLIRIGNQFQKDGVKGKYDSQIEYGVDFILRFAWDGKQRVAVVEKSVYAQALPVGSVIRDPSWSALMAAIRPKDVQRQAAPTKEPPVRRADVDHVGRSNGQGAPVEPSITDLQLRAVQSICRHNQISDKELEAAVEKIATGTTVDVRRLTESQARSLISALQKTGVA